MNFDTSTTVAPAAPTQPTPAPNPAPTPATKPAAEPPATMPREPAPAAMPDMPSPATPPALPPLPKTTTTSVEHSGSLTVWVPYDAKVTVNGLETRSTGSRRQFISYGLKSGLSYKYVIKASVVQNGQVVEDTKTISLTAGQVSSLAFGFNTAAVEDVAASH